MAMIPGLDADVFFGDTERPSPDWRKVLPDEADESDGEEPTPEEWAACAGMLGFDPREMTAAEPPAEGAV